MFFDKIILTQKTMYVYFELRLFCQTTIFEVKN